MANPVKVYPFEATGCRTSGVGTSGDCDLLVSKSMFTI